MFGSNSILVLLSILFSSVYYTAKFINVLFPVILGVSFVHLVIIISISSSISVILSIHPCAQNLFSLLTFSGDSLYPHSIVIYSIQAFIIRLTLLFILLFPMYCFIIFIAITVFSYSRPTPKCCLSRM